MSFTYKQEYERLIERLREALAARQVLIDDFWAKEPGLEYHDFDPILQRWDAADHVVDRARRGLREFIDDA